VRPTRSEWAFALARETAKRSTCLRRAVGCVLLNARGHVLATGYNGVAAGLPHCNEPTEEAPWRDARGELVLPSVKYPYACPAAHAASGTQLDGCGAIHAEQNALLQCPDVYAIEACYVTTPPCVTCTKLLLNTGCRVIYCEGDYPHAALARDLWASAARSWVATAAPR